MTECKVQNAMTNPFVLNKKDYGSADYIIINSGETILLDKDKWDSYVKKSKGAQSLIDCGKLIVKGGYERQNELLPNDLKHQELDAADYGLDEDSSLSNGKKVEVTTSSPKRGKGRKSNNTG